MIRLRDVAKTYQLGKENVVRAVRGVSLEVKCGEFVVIAGCSLFRRIHGKTGITILLVTHSSQLVPYGTRSVQMIGGLVTADSQG